VYAFIKNAWILGKLTEEQIDTYVAKGLLTQEQADEIRSLPRP